MQTFGPFELLRRLGAGGMAETFAAVKRGPGGFEQRLCVKRILPSSEHDPRFVAMFLEEARIAARLRHGTIVQVIETGDVEGTPYLALELVEGGDLRKLVDRGGALAPDVLGLVARELATALEIAHVEGVIHRDVSPSNVLLSVSGEVKLADFGIAKAHDSAARTATGIPKGKASYMAPEYAATARATPATDVFSLGVTLYEAATGRKPWSRGDRDDRAGRPCVRALAPAVPAPLADAIDRALEPDPARRFASAAALFDAIDLTPVPGTRRRLGAAVRALADAAPDPERTLPCAPPPLDEPTRVARAR